MSFFHDYRIRKEVKNIMKYENSMKILWFVSFLPFSFQYLVL